MVMPIIPWQHPWKSAKLNSGFVSGFCQLLQGCTPIFCWLIWLKKTVRSWTRQNPPKHPSKLKNLKSILNLISSPPCFPLFSHVLPGFSIIFHPGSRTPPVSPPPALPPWLPPTPRRVSLRHQPRPLRVRWAARRPVRYRRCPVSRKWEKGRGTSVFVESFFWSKLRKSKGIYGDTEGREELWWGIKLRNIYIVYIYISLSLSFYLSIYLPIYLSIYLHHVTV